MNTKFVYLAIMLVFVAACTSGENQGNNIEDPFIGGNAALNMFLQNGVPPPTVFDGGSNPFAIGLVMENIGE